MVVDRVLYSTHAFMSGRGPTHDEQDLQSPINDSRDVD